MRFSKIEAMRIPSKGAKQEVTRIRHKSQILWEPIFIRYVSLGDSIAAGHSINDNWERDYGTRSQYGSSGRTETAVVPGCYTDLIRQNLITKHGSNVNATSFAQSGDTVADLIEKLNHDVVRKAIAKAGYVTVCIGANNVLQPAMSNLGEYINTGSTSTIESTVESNLAVLSDDSNPNSYVSLFNKLKEINPKAKFVFSTIYNPYKYLWIEEGNNGFFGPVINSIPNIEIFGLDIDSLIKDSLLGAPIVKKLFDRVNGLNPHAEKFVNKLNSVLRSKISAYANPNFILADTKAVYDPVPDRPISSPKHYNDLVNVEYTKDYDTAKMNWGRLWEGSSAEVFWLNLATKYVSLSSGLNIDGFAEELVQLIIEKVIVPDVDPHPEAYGHHALYQSFSDALGWSTLPRRTITYVANGGTGYMALQKVVALDNMAVCVTLNENAFSHPTEGYHWNGWKDNGGKVYTNKHFISSLTGDLVLNAQWTNICTIAYYKNCKNEYVSPSGETGPVTKNGSEYYLRVTLGGTVLPGLGDAFDSSGKTPVRYINVPYGTELHFQLINLGEWDRGAVYLNGNKVAGNSEYCYYTMTVKHNAAIVFDWECEYGWDGIIPVIQSYWIAQMYEFPSQ